LSGPQRGRRTPITGRTRRPEMLNPMGEIIAALAECVAKLTAGPVLG
jgi:hypothetical protein